MVGYGPGRTRCALNHGSDDAEYSALAQLVEVAEIAQRTQDGSGKHVGGAVRRDWGVILPSG